MKTVVLWCTKGRHDWEREAQKGRRPLNCPRHSGVDAPKVEVKINVSEELSSIEGKLEYYIKEYEDMIKKSRGKKIDKSFWNHMESVQMRIINLGRRKRYLQSL